jgi:hypothetical protein
MHKQNSFIIIISILITTLKPISNSTCQNTSSKYIRHDKDFNNENMTWSLIDNFENFNDLILDCNQTYNITKYVYMLPKQTQILDKTFEFNRIFDRNQLKQVKLLIIGNLKGIDLVTKPFVQSRFQQITTAYIFLSKLDTYSNSVLIDSNKCDPETYYSNTSTNFARYFYGITIYDVYYPQKWCPYFFQNFDVVNLALFDIKNSFLIKNRLNFYKLTTPPSNVNLKHLLSLQLIMTFERLDENNLAPIVFKNVQRLGLAGILTGIEAKLFGDFQKLKTIDFALGNLKEFFHQGTNKWMTYLNLNGSGLLILKFIYLKQTVSFDLIYEYPNEDLCLFKNFPHERFVFPMIMPGRQLECTCTLYWLQSNIHRFKNQIKIVKDYSMNYEEYSDQKVLNKAFLYCNSSFNLTEVCNFKLCLIEDVTDGKEEFSHRLSLHNDSDILYIIKFLEFILLVILQPLFCLMGIFHNGLTILVITNKNKKKEFQHSMYRHIIINAVFNIVYCVITSFKLLNTCIFYGPSVFCSSVYQEFWAQYLKVGLIHFLGNVAKMCSNFSYLIFSISRLRLVEKQNERDLSVKSKKILSLIYILVLILVSCFLSIFKCFQYRINGYLSQKNTNKEFPFEARDERFCTNDEMHTFQCKLFNVFKIANRSLNDVLFVILNISVDLILLVKFKQHMDGKLRQISDVMQRHEIEKSKKNVNRMILFNSLIYIFSHLPEFTTTLLLIVYAEKISNFCLNKFSCDLLNEEAEFFGLISIVCQFYVFKIFDKNFKSSFSQIISHFNSSFFQQQNTAIVRH